MSDEPRFILPGYSIYPPGTNPNYSLEWNHDGSWALVFQPDGAALELISANAVGSITVAGGTGSGTITSGTTNRLPKYTASTTVGNSLLSDDATTLTYTGTGGLVAPKAAFNGTSNQIVLQSAGVTGTISWTPTGSARVFTIPAGANSNPVVPSTCTSGQFISAITSGGVLTCATPSSSSVGFDALTSGTNTTSAMIVGTGASLTVSGSGTNNATSLGGATFAAPGAIGGTTPAAGTFTTITGSSTITFSGISGSTQCLHVNSSGVVTGTGSDCSAAGSLAFSGITSATNTTAAMVVGTGSSLTVSGSGTINATTLGGATFAAPGTIGGTTPAAATFTTVSHSATSNQIILQSAGVTGTITWTPTGSNRVFTIPAGANSNPVVPTTCTSGDFISAVTSGGVLTCTTPSGSGNVTTGTLTANTVPKATGAMAIANSLLTDDATTLTYTGTGGASVPKLTTTGTAGSITATNIVAPSTPASGFTELYVDSTNLRFHDKNASGVIGTTVVADTGSSNNFLTAISAAGAVSKAQPSASNLSNGVVGSGAVVLATSPTITTPNLIGLVSASGGPITLFGSTSGSISLAVPAVAGGTFTITLPKGTTDFSATGGTSQVVKQTSAGGALTVAQLAFTDISGSITLAQAPTNAKVRMCTVIIGDPGAASSVLAADNDSPVACSNEYGTDWTITSVACWADPGTTGTTSVTPILTGGSATSILTGALTCGDGAWAAGTLNGTPVVHTFSGSGATCSSTPCSADVNLTAVDGATKYLVVKIVGTI